MILPYIIMKKTYIILLLCAAVSIAQAQKLSRSYQNQPLSEVLEDLNAATQRHEIAFVYNDLEDFIVTCSFDRLSLEDALMKVIGFYPVRVVRDGEKYFVECTYKTERHLTGTVVDENRQPVAFANIAILNPADSTLISGGVSNEAGQFVVPYEQHKILARITFIGYKTVYRLCTQEHLDTIQLQRDSYVLKGVEVKGEIPQYKMTHGGIDANVAGTLLSNMGSALNVLSELPRVSVDGDQVSVFAKGEPEIYINSKKVRDINELRELKSTDIKSVEVITNPGAQYNASVRSVIRIKTIRRTNEGLSFSSRSSVAYNSEWMGAEQAKASYRQKKLELFAQLNYNNRCQKDRNGFTQIITTPQEEVKSTIMAHVRSRFKTVGGKAGFNFDIDTDNSIGATYTIQNPMARTFDWKGTEIVWLNGQEAGTLDKNSISYISSRPSHNLDAYYAGKSGKLSVNFNGTLYWNSRNREDDMNETSRELDSRRVLTKSANRNQLQAAKLVMGHPIAKGQLTFGSEASHTKIHNIYISDYEPIPSTDNEINESHVALFAEYNLPICKQWSLRAGLRYEHASNEYLSFGERLDDRSRVYDDLFPNLSIAWQKKKWGAELVYGKTVSRPSYNALTRHLQYDSRYMYEGGNPLLRPQFEHNIGLNLVYSWFNFSADYSYQKDCIMQLTNLYENQTISLTKYENGNHYQTLNASIVASPKFGWYQPQLTLYYWQQLFDGKPYGISQNLKKPYFCVLLNSRFVLGKSAFIGLNLRGFTNSSRAITNRKGRFITDLKFYKGFCNNRWALNIDINDLFYQNIEQWEGYGNGTFSSKENHANSRRATITLTYQFNQKRSKYKGTGAGSAEKNRL